jgi:hypothetical protein
MLLLAAAIVMAAVGLAAQWVSLPRPDVAWLLYAAGRVADGAVIGVDVVENSPPIILWLKVPLVRLADALAVDRWQVFLVVLALLSGGSLWLTDRVARQATALLPQRRTLAVGGVIVLFVLPAQDFGQREHLSLILALPYVALWAIRASGGPVGSVMAAAAGVMAGFAFAIKPHFVLPWLMLVGGAAVRDRRGAAVLRPEHVLSALTGLACAVAVLGFAPEYVSYARRFGPLYLEYLAESPLVTFFTGEAAAPVLLAYLTAIALWRMLPGHLRALPAALLLAAAGYHLAGAVQMKGWGYHFLPAGGLAVIALLAIWQHVPRPVPWLAPRVYAAAAAAALTILPLVRTSEAFLRLRRPYKAVLWPDHDLSAHVRLIRERVPAGGSVLVLSTNLQHVFPLVTAAGVESASRYPALILLGALYGDQIFSGRPIRYRVPADRGSLELEIGRNVREDLVRFRPNLILTLLPRLDLEFGEAGRFEYLKYFGMDPGFRAELRAYRTSGDLGGFRILERRDNEAADTTGASWTSLEPAVGGSPGPPLPRVRVQVNWAIAGGLGLVFVLALAAERPPRREQ